MLPVHVVLATLKSPKTLLMVKGGLKVIGTGFGLVTFTDRVLGVPTVTVPNFSGFGENVGATSVPVPLSVIVEGLFPASL